MENVTINISEQTQEISILVKEDGRHLPHGGWVGTAQDLYDLLRATDPAKNEKFTLTQQQIDQKYITLAGTVIDNQSIRVFVANVGLLAEIGVDYSYSGNDIFWTSYEFETKLKAGDILHVFYY